MTKECRLKSEAIESCRFRQHTMGRFKRHDFYPYISYAHCAICDKQVVVNCHPQPNQIDIGGEAVALNCVGELK